MIAPVHHEQPAQDIPSDESMSYGGFQLSLADLGITGKWLRRFCGRLRAMRVGL